MGRVGRWVRSFRAFWWDFIVGDDWRVAAGVVAAFGATAAVARAGVPAWWLLPVAVLIVLGVSLAGAARAARRG
jgi:hypothetical protein